MKISKHEEFGLIQVYTAAALQGLLASPTVRHTGEISAWIPELAEKYGILMAGRMKALMERMEVNVVGDASDEIA